MVLYKNEKGQEIIKRLNQLSKVVGTVSAGLTEAFGKNTSYILVVNHCSKVKEILKT